MVTSNFVTLVHKKVSPVIRVKLQIAILQIGMAALNNTGSGQQKTVEDLVCSPDLTAGLHGQLIFISVFDSFLSVTWECSDPNYASHGVFTSSAAQTLSSLPCNN